MFQGVFHLIHLFQAEASLFASRISAVATILNAFSIDNQGVSLISFSIASLYASAQGLFE